MTGGLFPEPEPPPIPGLSLLEDWITAGDEARLIAIIDAQPWRTDLKRRDQHYGYRYDYRARRVGPEDYLGPLPDWTADITRRLVDEALFARAPDQMIVNEYLPGQGIAPHIDCVPCFGDTIASLSLGSHTVMRFSRGSAARDIWLPARSLVVLSGEARFEWKHGIAGRKSDGVYRHPRERRLSVTIRTIFET